MRKWTKTAGVLFMAASAVYTGQVAVAAAAKSATPGNGAKPAAQPAAAAAEAAPVTDPAAAETANPTTAPSADATAAADPFAAPANAAPVAAAPAGEGQSVSAPEVNINDAGTVEIHVNDANLVEVLRMLSLQAQKNIVASKEVRGTVTANLYDVTVREALDAILKANGYGYREKGNFIYVYTAKEIADIEKAERQPVTEVFRLHYTPAANAVTMIKPVLSPEAQVSFTTPAKNGIESGPANIGGDAHATEDIIVVSDFPDRMEQVRRILREVDARPQQVLVEAVIMRATLQENNELGIDFTALGGIDFNNLAGLGSSGGSGGSGGGTSGGTSGSSLGSGTSQALTGSILENPDAGPIIDKNFVAGSLGGNGLKVGVVTNNIALFINALEGVTDTVIMANPKVLVLNKQKGEVHVGAKLGYKTSVSTEVLATQDVKFLEVGTRLIFRPYIGDNGYIRLEVKPEDSSGQVDSNGLPSEFVTEVTTNVMVKDGRTIVIGGLFRESTDVSRSGVPVLQNLPGVGPLFRKQKDSTVREEVIILLTPHIVKDEENYFAESERELAGTEKMRVGVRRGMMPWGRERLAETAYEQAMAELAKPNPDRQKVLWHLDSAINLNPKFREAIEQKQRITGEVVTSVDNSSIRSFVRRQIMAERGTDGGTMTAPAAPMAPAAPRSRANNSPAMKPTTVPTEFSASAEPTAAEPTEPVAAEPTTAPSESEPAVAESDPTATPVEPAVAQTDPATEPAQAEAQVDLAPVTPGDEGAPQPQGTADENNAPEAATTTAEVPFGTADEGNK